jgi:hypothetical protein
MDASQDSQQRSLGEIGIVTTKDKIQGKLNNRGTPCMFVGYSVHHAYRMLNIETQMIINSRNIIWLNEMHKYWIGRKVKNQLIDDDEDADVMESKIQLLMRAKRLLNQLQIKMT